MIEKNFWNEMRRFRNNMDRFFSYPDFPESFDEQDKPANYRKAWANFEETENSFIIIVEIPGVDKENVHLEITDDNVLVIRAEKKKEAEEETPEEEGIYRYRYAKAYAGFYRTIALPESADTDKLDAEYKDGILKITVPKTREAKKKKIIRVR